MDLSGWGAAAGPCPVIREPYGPQGTGRCLCGAEGKPLLYGGTGSMSRLQDMPRTDWRPGPRICRASQDCWRGIRFVRRQGVDAIAPGAPEVAPQIPPGPGGAAGVGCSGTGFGTDRRGVLRDGGRNCEAVRSWPARVLCGRGCTGPSHRTAGTLETGTCG